MTAQQQADWTAFVLSAIALITTAVAMRVWASHTDEHRVCRAAHTFSAALLLITAVVIITSP